MKTAKSAIKPAKNKKGENPENGTTPFVVGALPLENERWEMFIQELLMLKPQVRAYQRAFPDAQSYSGANASAHALLQNPTIIARMVYLKDLSGKPSEQ